MHGYAGEMDISGEEKVSPLVEAATQNDLTCRMIGAAMAVHNALGPGRRNAPRRRWGKWSLLNLRFLIA
jgi:hypothetical protein